MIKFLFKRLFYGFLVLIGVITIVFLLFNVLPGDPARMMLGQRADVTSIDAINKVSTLNFQWLRLIYFWNNYIFNDYSTLVLSI